jgi:two-component system nitrate/nitrite sensor histidine kinase NarX
VESNESIIFRSGLTMSGIVLLALLSMISSVFIAESSKGDAAAINLAGSLRMQSYRIATRLQQPDRVDAYPAQAVEREISEFERRLDHLWQTGAISLKEAIPAIRTLRTISQSWLESLKPTLKIGWAGHVHGD